MKDRNILMDRVWEAYWRSDLPGTEAALNCVVDLVLEQAARIADDHVDQMRIKLQPHRHREPRSDLDVVMFESAQSEASDIAKNIRTLICEARS